MDMMDKGTMEEKLRVIREQMPETYKAIQAKAVERSDAYGLVRRGLRGEANCFWACERGHVVGTPFAGHEIERDVAHLMVQFGATFVCLWGAAANGAN
jgi:hypothetical protein